MKIVSPNKVRYGNYLFPIKAQSHTENLQKLLILFSKRKFSPAAVCSVPQYWAKAIRLSIMKMLEIDPEIEIGHIKERSGRLSINIFTVTVDAERLLSIDDLIWGLKNTIDYAVSSRINMCKIEDIDNKWLAIPTNLGATNAGMSPLY
jgi:hypothetical protein